MDVCLGTAKLPVIVFFVWTTVTVEPWEEGQKTAGNKPVLLIPDSAWEHSAGLDGRVCDTHSFVISVAWECNPRFYTSNPQRNCRRLGSSVSGRNDHHQLRKPHTSHVLTPQWQQSGKQEQSLVLLFSHFCLLGRLLIWTIQVWIPALILSGHCVNLESQETSLNFPPSLECFSIPFCPGLSQDYPLVPMGLGMVPFPTQSTLVGLERWLSR